VAFNGLNKMSNATHCNKYPTEMSEMSNVIDFMPPATGSLWILEWRLMCYNRRSSVRTSADPGTT